MKNPTKKQCCYGDLLGKIDLLDQNVRKIKEQLNNLKQLINNPATTAIPVMTDEIQLVNATMETIQEICMASQLDIKPKDESE
jgi:hypothetical protein